MATLTEHTVGVGCDSDSQAARPAQNQEAPSPSVPFGPPADQRISPTKENMRILCDAQLAVLRLLSCLTGDAPAAVSSILAIESLLSELVSARVRRVKNHGKA